MFPKERSKQGVGIAQEMIGCSKLPDATPLHDQDTIRVHDRLYPKEEVQTNIRK